MSERPTRQPRVHFRSGAIALALLAPAAEPAVAGANDLPAQGGSEGTGDHTPQQPDTGDVEDENTPPLGTPGDNSDPNEGENENGPLEPEPPVEPPQEGEPPQEAPPTPPVPPAAAPAPPPVIPQSTAPAPVPDTRSVPAPASKAPPVRRKAEPEPERKAPKRRAARQATPRPAAPSPVRPATPAPPSPSTTAVATPAAEPAASGPTHTVRAGDSLWAIANARLGPGASAAQIAREVQRLWDLNARAIGTGDPSLLRVGVKLRLR